MTDQLPPSAGPVGDLPEQAVEAAREVIAAQLGMPFMARVNDYRTVAEFDAAGPEVEAKNRQFVAAGDSTRRWRIWAAPLLGLPVEVPMPASRRRNAVYICEPDYTPGPRGDCPNPLHDHPLPTGYIAAAEVAAARLRKRWPNVKCPDCGLYGWRPGQPLSAPYDGS